MESDKKTEEKTTAPAGGGNSQPAADLSTKPNEETVDATAPMSAAGAADDNKDGEKKEKETGPAKPKASPLQSLKKFRLYALIVLLVVIVAAVYFIVPSLNGKKTPPPPTFQNETLSQSDLKSLTNSNNTVGGSGETLNVQGNSDLTGNIVVKGNLNVAGTIQSGSQFTLAQVKVSGPSVFNSAQINSLQVANSDTMQAANFQSGMNVAGGLDFTGPVNFASLTDTDLVLSANAQIQGHISFAPPTNAAPYRQISFGVLGNGGSASVFGTDTSGTVNINTGNNPLPGCFITIIFDIPFNNTPNILISPVGYGAGASQYFITETTKSFRICTNNAAPANQAFAFDYFVGATPD